MSMSCVSLCGASERGALRSKEFTAAEAVWWPGFPTLGRLPCVSLECDKESPQAQTAWVAFLYRKRMCHP